MWRDEAYLLDMLIAAREARDFSEGLTWKTFQQSSFHQHAIAKALENIGKASTKSVERNESCSSRNSVERDCHIAPPYCPRLFPARLSADMANCTGRSPHPHSAP